MTDSEGNKINKRGDKDGMIFVSLCTNTQRHKPDLWARSGHRGAARRSRQQFAAGSESSMG